MSMILSMVQATSTTRTAPIKMLRFWKKGLLLLILIPFLAVCYFLLQLSSTGKGDDQPSILYLADDETGTLQLFQSSAPKWQPVQLTIETADLLSYAPAQKENLIAYVVALPVGGSTILLLDFRNRVAVPPKTLLTCRNAECSQPVWHPDGRRLLYERRIPPGFSRPQLWWLDSITGETVPLLEKATAIGSNARFSPDGNWVSFSASPDEGNQLYNFVNGRSLTFPSNVGTPAAWHPLNSQLLIPNSRSIAVNLYLVSLSEQPTTQRLSSDGAFDDGNPAWSPNGEWIAFGRRLARTNTGRQLWLMRADGSEAQSLTNDITIHYGPPSWSADGRYLLFQQYNSNTPDQPPTIWLLEISSGTFTQIINNGLLPVWLPR